MRLLPMRCLAGMLVLTLGLPVRAEPNAARNEKPSPPTSSRTTPSPSPAPARPEGHTLASLSLPANAVVIVCGTVKEALDLIPSSVVLTSKQFQELQAELERLRRRVAASRPLAPSTCQLKGKVEPGHVDLQVVLKLAPNQPGAVFALGCAQAALTSAVLEGRTPLLRSEADGFSVQTEKEEPQQLTLDLKVPLTGRSTVQGFELSLPRAAGITLDLELPGGARDIQVGGKPLDQAPLLRLNGNRLQGGLGPGLVDRLELSWRLAPASGEPIRTAEGQVLVRFEPGGQISQAELTLRADGGPVGEWRVLVPPGAELRPAPGAEERLRIETAQDPKLGKHVSERIVRLNQPSTEPVRLHVTAHAALTRGGTAPVGPFFVVGALRQTGTILVRNTVANLHLDFQPHGNMARQELTEEQRHDPALLAVYRYYSVPWVDRPQGSTGEASLSWIDIETEPIHGQVLTRTSHALSLHAESEGGPLLWHIQTRITATPRWTDVDHLRVQLPSGWEPDSSSVEPGPATPGGALSFKLLRDATDKAGRSPTIGPIDGRYPRAQGPRGRFLLVLPHAEEAIDQGGEISLQVPVDTEVVLPGAEQAGLEAVEQTPHKQTWRGRHLPRQVEIEWQPYRPPVQAQSVVDLVWQDDHCLVESQEIHFQLLRGAPQALMLRLPPGVSHLSAVDADGPVSLSADSESSSLRQVQPRSPLGKEYRLTLRYTLPKDRSSPSKLRKITLAAPEGVTRSQTRVRVWSDPGRVPVLAGDQPGWEELKIEEAPGRQRLPVLVLQSARGDLPLLLRAGEPSPVHTVLVEEGLVRVQMLASGAQHYHVFFRLRQVAGSTLEVELPAPVSMLNLILWLDGKLVPFASVNEAGQQTDAGTIARCSLGDLARPGSLLEMVYHLPQGRAGTSSVRSILQPPQLHGSPNALPLRWQVLAPPGWVLLAPETSPDVERTWQWNGWMLTPRLVSDAQGSELLAHAVAQEEDSVSSPSIVCWQSASEPLAIIHFSQQAWLLLCSLSLLLVGLLLSWLARPQAGVSFPVAGWLLPLLALAALGVALLDLIWPTPLSAILYGCQPGAAVLLVVVLIQWLLHERYRRQIVFLPSFSRTRSGSSLQRASSLQQAHGEPSTVDVAQPSASGGSGPRRGT